MKFNERLQELLGHEVWIVLVPLAAGDEEENGNFCGGNLLEVGDDYIFLCSKDENTGASNVIGAEWFIPLEKIYTVIH